MSPDAQERRPKTDSSKVRRTPTPGTLPVPPDRIWQKEAVVAQRYLDDQRALGLLLLDEGHTSQREIDRGIKDATNLFMLSRRERQIELSQTAGAAIEARLDRIIPSNIVLLDELLKEAGEDPADITGEIMTWKLLFEQAPRRTRVEAAFKLRDEVGDKLIGSFDRTLESWRQSLAEMGKSPEEIEKTVNALSERFSTASKRGKVGIAKDLRERIVASTSSRFSAFLDMYASYNAQLGHRIKGEELLSPEEWRERFEAASGARRTSIVDQLEGKLRLFINPDLWKQEPKAISPQPETAEPTEPKPDSA